MSSLPDWWPSDKPCQCPKDCLEGMKELPEKCIDLIVTSPPYDNLRDYNGHSTFDFEGIAKEIYRIMKDGGVVVWVVGDATIDGSETGTSFRQALFFKEIGFNLHDTMIYKKINPQPMNDKRYNASFEYMFVFSKGNPKTFNPLLESCIHAGMRNTGTKYEKDGSLSKKWGYGKKYKKEKIKANIFEYTVGTEKVTFKHPARFPEQLAKDHILSWSNEGDVVLDTFVGSGTTLKMCIMTGRIGLGFEIDARWKDLIVERSMADIKPLEAFF